MPTRGLPRGEAVPMPSPLPETLGSLPRRHDTGRGADMERALGLVLGRAYPWLGRVERPPDAGMLWARFLLEHAEAANEPALDLVADSPADQQIGPPMCPGEP